MDETAGTVASEIWSVGATVYSLLAGRSPFEIPGGENKSVDLISRINRAKPQPIGRPDVPPRLEAILQRAMSKRPEQRPASVLELIRELQSVESELGVPQTQLEVAMDDWALATVADLEDRTRVRGIPSPKGGPERRRRRNKLAETSGDYRSVGTLMRPQSGSLDGSLAARGAQSARSPWLMWTLAAAAVLVLALGATAAFVLFRAASDSIPTVGAIQAEVDGRSVDFSWDDVAAADDSYRIATSDGASSVQKGTAFSVDGNGRPVCITVTVLRDGRPGTPSPEKCAGG
jgi:hypothetical protein